MASERRPARLSLAVVDDFHPLNTRLESNHNQEALGRPDRFHRLGRLSRI